MRVLGALALALVFAGTAFAQVTQLQITTSSLPGGVASTPTTAYPPQALNATGGTPPYTTWTIASGSLPPGLSLGIADGVISGDPTAAGSYPFVVRVTDSGAQIASRSLTIVITPPLAITTSSLPEGRVGAAYPTQALAASGGTPSYFWSVIGGTLPTGMGMSSGGVISGTPTISGRFNFRVRATDSSNPTQTASQDLSIAVPPTITTTSPLTNGAFGLTYGPVTLTATAGATPYFWTVTAGSLPAGLTLSDDGVNGIISGTPTAAGTSDLTSSFTITLTDSSSSALSTSKDFEITVQPQLTFTTASSLPLAITGVFYSQQINTTGPSSVTWSVTSGTVPPGLALQSSGTVSGTASVAGTFDFTVQATAGSPVQTASRAFQLVVNPALTITTFVILPEAKLNASYSVSLNATGGRAPYTWTILGGQLPPGLSLSSAGVLSGTPASIGTLQFAAQVGDSFTPQQQASRTFQITVTDILTITTTSLPNGVAGTAYSQTLTSINGTPPLSWSVLSGTLPTGLTLASGTGALSGTPTVSGSFNPTIAVTDSSSPAQTVSRAFPITIQPILTITTSASLPQGIVGGFYSKQMDAIGPSPLTWSVVSGSLPPGLSLSSINGTVSGTPSASGTFGFTLQAAGGNPSQTATKAFQLVVSPTVSITTFAILPDARLSVTYTLTLAATGGASPYTWAVTGGQLPQGLTLSSSGTVSGTPLSIGTFQFVAQASDSYTPQQQTSRAFQISVLNTFGIATTSLPVGAVGSAYPSQTLTAGPGTQPFTWSVSAGSLPPGLTLSGEGILTGTPTTAGASDFTISVTDRSSPALTATKAFAITIRSALTITTTSPLPLGVAGVFYVQSLAASETSFPVTWSGFSGILPPGLTLTSSGSIFGTPLVAGTFGFTVQAAGGEPAQTARQAFQLVINPALAISPAATLPDGALSVAYSASLAATGGVAPYTWTVAGGAPPSGLSLSSSGAISGTPAGLGAFSFTAKVSDSFSPTQEAIRTFTITVTSTFAISTATLPNAIPDLAYSQQLQTTGGTGPFSWSVTNGKLPVGLTLSAAGLLSGTATLAGSETFTVTVTDSRAASTTRTFTLVVDPPVSAFSVPTLPASLTPTKQQEIVLTLSAPHPSALSGQLNLSFTSNSEVPGDDPMTRFSTGSRSVSFTIPANSTTAVFASRVLLLAGTVAGTVKLTANIQNGPSGLPVATVELVPVAPQITNVQATRTPGGLEVLITGYASARRVSSVEFAFDVTVGTTTERIPLTKSVETEFGNWYRSSTSTAFGSAFSYVQAFTVSGDPTAIKAVTVRLTNAQGSTSSVAIPFQ